MYNHISQYGTLLFLGTIRTITTTVRFYNIYSGRIFLILTLIIFYKIFLTSKKEHLQALCLKALPFFPYKKSRIFLFSTTYMECFYQAGQCCNPLSRIILFSTLRCLIEAIQRASCNPLSRIFLFSTVGF